ncbi:bifunctional riboflavin kinase/FAD synthetase [SAR92 clade bacterium H231]|nr:bifunctional riboflavin kinase/FAD synthetase [Porticoccaceae bacterium]MBT7258380.1 bifunctional riboflavin kinase/FAD synthetase [Porticoccaceae bacterium]MCT2531732.1 bifunctional riboflavin kinase/FAD synthetase [SAR92 clade bacterium H231]MDA7853400.1 bifunctional riboflavin kinase/FAD synthetase [Porticoccaceae bacterium]
MTFIRDLQSLQSFNQRSVVTIGSFDGVHLGHQAILNQVKAVAAELGLPSVVMTFEPQPQEFFSGERAPARLMRLREKVDALFEFGVDQVLCLQFNRELRNLTAAEFVRSVLVDGLGTRHLIVGDDFRFGCDRSGDFKMLSEMGETYDFAVQDTETLEVDGQRVSSTLVRQILEQGNFERASQLLGKPFTITGRVVYGQQLGRELGFPTANVQLNRYSAPLSGVYAVLVNIDGAVYQGAANVGLRPTVGDLLKPILEVHLLDFEADLYGRRIEVEFVTKIRDEEKFTSLDKLIESIQRDVKQIRAWFAGDSENII